MRYQLALEKNLRVVSLTPNNIALVEAFITYDSDYSRSGDKNAAPDNNFHGSTAFWMNELRKHLTSTKEHCSYIYQEVVSNAVSAVDRENSTHINADGVGRAELTSRLLQLTKKEFMDLLKNPKADYKLINILSAKTHPTRANAYARVNYSFATKFCHYACMGLFEGLDEQDNFSIFDNVVAKAIPLYTTMYKIPFSKNDLFDYPKYVKLIDEIIKKSKSEISRNGFDHLLWYYYKAR